jgi:MFS family permease
VTTTTPVTRSPFAEPIRRVGGGWIALFATAWFGIWMAQLTPIQYLLPNQVALYVEGDWLAKVVAFGVVSGIAGFFALITYPLTGFLSDRTTSRFGRRRPWMLAGVVIFGVSLIVLGLQTTFLGIAVFWSTALIGFCIASAAITATISDQVPVNQRGFVSGWISAPQAIGTIAGVELVTTIVLSPIFGYVVVGVVVIVFSLPFIFLVPDQVLRRDQRPKGVGLVAVVQGFWINPVKHPDFGWTLLGRILVNLGNALGTALLLYFLQFGLHMTKTEAGNNITTLILVYLVFFVAAAIVCGRLSDRLGRRKVFVYISAYLQAIAALLLAFFQTFEFALIGAGLLGLGYGCYMAVDQALATQVLPDSHSRGKDLGIMNIATAVPQAVGPLLGVLVISLFANLATVGATASANTTLAGESAGFTALYVASGVLAILGGVAMIPIKSVK